MFCVRCGLELESTAEFCRRCGAAVGPQLMPSRGRVAIHIRLLCIIWLGLSAFRLGPGFGLLAFYYGRFLPEAWPEHIYDFLPMIGGFFLVSAALGMVVGWALLTRRKWARAFAIVVGVLNLFDLPFGLPLGIYTLWVLLPEKSEDEYRSVGFTKEARTAV